MEISNTNLNLYKSFIVVCETRNLHRASEVLNISREAIRQNIKELSNQLNTSLFNSNNKGVEPTELAKSLYPEIKNALEIIAQTEKSLNNKTQSTIKMSVHNLFIKYYLNDYLKDFYAKYPNIQLEFQKGNGTDLLSNNKVDFIIDANYSLDTNFKFIRLFPEKSNSHFVASKDLLKKHGLTKDIKKEDLLKLPIIEREDILPIYQKFLNTNQTPTFIKVPSSDIIFSMVKNGVGIGCFAQWLIENANDPEIVKLNISDITLPSLELVCCYKKTLSKPAQVFIDGLLAFCNKKQ